MAKDRATLKRVAREMYNYVHAKPREFDYCRDDLNLLTAAYHPPASGFDHASITWDLVGDEGKVFYAAVSGHNGDYYDQHTATIQLPDAFFEDVIARLTPAYREQYKEEMLQKMIPDPFTVWENTPNEQSHPWIKPI